MALREAPPAAVPSARPASDLTAFDALDLPARSGPPAGRRAFDATWPKLLALVVFLGLWQLVVWSGWKEEYVLPGPATVLPRLVEEVTGGEVLSAVATTMRRALTGFFIALAIGVGLGSLVARRKVPRAALGSLITGLQTMPSIAWFPLAIVLFKLSEGAILFVVVLGAAPAIANGLIAGIDQIPSILQKAGRVMGARKWQMYRHVIMPGALPGFVSGLKQGWAFAWRSLLAGELLVIITSRPSLGTQLSFNRDNNDYEGLLATMLVILIVGIVVDAVFFGRLERAVLRRWGLRRD